MAHTQDSKKIPQIIQDELVPLRVPVKPSVSSNPYRALRRYSMFDPNFGQVEFFEHLPIFNIPDNNRDGVHIVTSTEEHRIDLISFMEYGTVVWWWLLCAAQDPPIFDSIQEIVQGKILKVPYLPSIIGRAFR